jgi:hypothetical protein
VEFPPAIPFTCQATSVVADPEVVSVNCSVSPIPTDALSGLMVM